MYSSECLPGPSKIFCALAGSGVSAGAFLARFLLLLVLTSAIFVSKVRFLPRARFTPN